MNGFVDIHTHILPGADDGAQNFAEALELIRLAWDNGTRTIFLTPHYRGKYRANSAARLRERFQVFFRAVKEKYPDMKLYLGSEVHYEADAPELLSQGAIHSMNDSWYVLLEFRQSAPSSQILHAVSEVIRYGYTPIIAHLERYDAFYSSPGLVSEVLDLGSLIQLNAASVMGRQGLKVKLFCAKLLKSGVVHFIASDAHDSRNRPPLLRECYLWVRKKYGAQYASELFYGNAQHIIKN